MPLDLLGLHSYYGRKGLTCPIPEALNLQFTRVCPKWSCLASNEAHDLSASMFRFKVQWGTLWGYFSGVAPEN